LFLDLHQNQKFALLKLRDKRLSEIYPSLRTLFASWYSEHPQLPRLAELKALVNSRPVRSRSFSLPASTSLARRLDEARWAPTLMSKWVQERMDAALRNEVIPFFSDCLEEALKEATAHAKRLGRGVISALKANPRNLEPLRIFMSQRGITFSIDNMRVSASNLEQAYNNIYAKTVGDRCQQELAKLNDTPPFPLEKVIALDRSISLREFVGKATTKGKTLKEGIDWVSGMFEIFTSWM
jgi:hypothetical protein